MTARHLAGLQDRHQVLVLDLGRHACLALEASAVQVALGQRLSEDLEGDRVAVELVLGPVHDAHRPLTEHLLQDVGPDAGARTERFVAHACKEYHARARSSRAPGRAGPAA